MINAIKKLKKIKAKRVFVQFPEGIKLKIEDITKELEKAGFEVVVCIEPCFGACDIRENEARLLNCDAILHIGHENYGVKTTIPVVFWEYFLEKNPLPILEKEFQKLEKFKKIGLITSLQFVQSIPTVKKFLEERGKKVFVYKDLQYPGQVLGCRTIAAKKIERNVDCFLAISAGKFYAQGLILSVKKPVFNLDLEKEEIHSLEGERRKLMKIIAWNKSQLKDAKKIGLLVSWKLGQFKLPYELKRKLERQGKEVYILAMDEITPEKIEGLKLDGLINLACPRIATDDVFKYSIPILNMSDLE